MAAAGVQTAQTVLRLHSRLSSDSARTYPGLKDRVFIFWKRALDCPRTVLGLHTDCLDSTQTAWTPLGLSSESLRIGGCRVKYCYSGRFQSHSSGFCQNDQIPPVLFCAPCLPSGTGRNRSVPLGFRAGH